MEKFQMLMSDLAIVGVISIALWLLRTKKQTLVAIVNNLIQLAEVSITGSTKLGEEKKKWVLQQLEILGYSATDSVSKLIEDLVKTMNDKQSSLLTQIENTASDSVDVVAEEITNSIQKEIESKTK